MSLPSSGGIQAKRIVVVGATGLIGKAVCAKLAQKGYSLTIFSRNPQAAQAAVPGAASYIVWQPEESGSWAGALDGAAGVINLAGAPLFVFGKRWTYEDVRQESDNRIQGIAGLVRAMREAATRPNVFVNASSVGYYGYSGYTDEEMEEDHPAGSDFWGQDSLRWEEAALQAETLGVRTVLIRTGYVLDPFPGGGLRQQAEQFRRGFGGWIRPGKQWLPWIHLEDEAGLIVMALEDDRIRGGLNGTAPEAPRSRDFARTLGRVVGKRAWLPIPQVGIRSQLGVVSAILTNGRRVVPNKAQQLGYQFQYPQLEQAMRHLLTEAASQPGQPT